MTEHIQNLIRGVFSFNDDKRRQAVRVLLDAMSEEGYFPPISKIDRLTTRSKNWELQVLFNCSNENEIWKLEVSKSWTRDNKDSLVNWSRKYNWSGDRKEFFKVQVTKIEAFLNAEA